MFRGLYNQKDIIYSEDGVFFELNIRKGWKMNNKADCIFPSQLLVDQEVPCPTLEKSSCQNPPKRNSWCFSRSLPWKINGCILDLHHSPQKNKKIWQFCWWILKALIRFDGKIGISVGSQVLIQQKSWVPKGTPPMPPTQEIAGLIKGLLTVGFP